MANNSNIEWTDATWNPVAGCSIVSPGCHNCYAMPMSHRLAAMGQAKYVGTTKKSGSKTTWTGKINLDLKALDLPPSWRKPRRVFVNSMSDLFHVDVPFTFIDRVFALMAICPQHTFQILTKRAERMQKYFATRTWNDVIVSMLKWHGSLPMRDYGPKWLSLFSAVFSTECGGRRRALPLAWPLPNVQLGVSVEDQQRADERIPHLINTPAAVRFLSAEPLLGRIGLSGQAVDWVIVGGESGPNARPMHPDWVRHLRNQCQTAGVPFFFKQWGEWLRWGECPHELLDKPRFEISVGGSLEVWLRVGKANAGRLLDGREWNEFPSPNLQPTA